MDCAWGAQLSAEYKPHEESMPQGRVPLDAPQRTPKGKGRALNGIKRERQFAHSASIFRVNRVENVCPLAVRSLPTDS